MIFNHVVLIRFERKCRGAVRYLIQYYLKYWTKISMIQTPVVVGHVSAPSIPSKPLTSAAKAENNSFVAPRERERDVVRALHRSRVRRACLGTIPIFSIAIGSWSRRRGTRKNNNYNKSHWLECLADPASSGIFLFLWTVFLSSHLRKWEEDDLLLEDSNNKCNYRWSNITTGWPHLFQHQRSRIKLLFTAWESFQKL